MTVGMTAQCHPCRMQVPDLALVEVERRGDVDFRPDQLLDHAREHRTGSIDEVTLDFGVADAAAHCHVPFLVSPYGYSTYRGS